MTMAPPESSSVAYNVSQHYHHSAHVASTDPSATARPQPLTTSYSLDSHGIDSRMLSQSQVDLFQNAGIEQRQRLIQAWQLYLNSAVERASMPHSALSARDSEMTDCSSDGGDDQRGHAEPYMISGYEVASQRNLKPRREPTTGEPYVLSTDPVYCNQQWWEVARVGTMESQYGASDERKRYPVV